MLKLPDFPADTKIIVKRGNPFICKGKNSFVINPGFFAEKMLQRYELIRCAAKGWFKWNGTCWESIREEALLRMVSEMLYAAIMEYDLQIFDKVNAVVLQGILSLMKIEIGEIEVPEMDPDVLPVQNGILKWNDAAQKFDFRSYAHDDIIFLKMNVRYAPGTTSAFFMEKIAEILPNEDDRRVVQEYMGACLFPLNKTRKFLLLQGEGGCGKSRLPILLTSILTSDRVFDLNFDSIRQNYEFSSLEEQTLLTASEAVSQAFSQASGAEFVKKIVGGDFFQTKQKFRNKKVDHVGHYSLIIMSNNSLRFQYDGRGDEFRDRLIPILLETHVAQEKQDQKLQEKLFAERDAIFNWFLEGAARVRKNDWKIELSPEQQCRRDRIIESTKGVEIFIRNHIRLAVGESFSTKEAYNAYAKLQRDDGFEYLEETVFQKRLAKAMFEIHKATSTNTLGGGRVRGYRGFALEK